MRFLSLLTIGFATVTLLSACAGPVGGPSASSSSSSFSISSSVSSADIQVTVPQPNAQVMSPLTVSGSARGTWYFEASFPVKLLDGSGNLLTQAPAQARGDWMTTDFVPFSVTLTFPMPLTATGTLVFEKDNPSGLPENAASVSVPVVFY